MTDTVRLHEIQQRLDAATPGPWEAAHVARSQYGTPIHGPFGSAGRADEGAHIANAFRDADFIAAAPEDIRVLLGLTRELRDALRAVTIDEMGGEPDLFYPNGGWEAWDGRARALLSRIEETPQ